MNAHIKRLTNALAAGAALALTGPAAAETTIQTFDNFVSDALYASWITATIESGPTAYTVTATGYGSNWKYLGTPIDASGETTVELTVTLSSTATNEGRLGPIVTLVDGDGSAYNYAWYGQLNGHHVLTMPVDTPTWVSAQGTVPGLDLTTLTHLHMQLDPSSYSGQYTVSWEHLRLIGAPGPTITACAYNRDTSEFTLTWNSRPGRAYAIFYSPDLTGPFNPLVMDIFADGASTTYTLMLPPENTGYLRVLQQ